MASRAPRLDPGEEAALLEAARSGSRAERDAAYRRLFSAFREPVFALCLQLTGSAADAEDAFQECFVAMYRGLPGFRGEARLGTWLYRIAVREALRQRGRRGRDDVALEIEPQAPDAGNPAARREELEEFRRAFERLGSEHRTVLALFAIDGMSHAAIAEVLKVPEGTIWSRLHKARKRLADEMRPKSGRAGPSADPASQARGVAGRRLRRGGSRSTALRLALDIRRALRRFSFPRSEARVPANHRRVEFACRPVASALRP